jgi:hypothetical protein
MIHYFKNFKLKALFLRINEATAITIFFRRLAEKSLGLLRIKLQKLTFCSNAINIFFISCNQNKKMLKGISLNKMLLSSTTLIIFFSFCVCQTLYAREDLFYYEEAIKTERVSSILSIPLYEEFLRNNPPKKYSEAVVGRLFDLYINNNKYDDLIILTGNYNLDKSKRLRLEELYKKLSKTFGISDENFQSICKLVIKKDNKSLYQLIEIYNLEKNRYTFNYIFAIKLKINDYNSIQYMIESLPEMNPILKVIYYVKINSSKIKSAIEDAAKLDNNDELRKELFYLYGLYLNKNKRFKESIRYHKMSLSYEKVTNISYSPRSTLEISKNLYTKGYPAEACLNISEKKILILNESDEFMKIYCDQTRSKELKMIYPLIKFLAKKEMNFIFKRFSNDNNL